MSEARDLYRHLMLKLLHGLRYRSKLLTGPWHQGSKRGFGWDRQHCTAGGSQICLDSSADMHALQRSRSAQSEASAHPDLCRAKLGSSLGCSPSTPPAAASCLHVIAAQSAKHKHPYQMTCKHLIGCMCSGSDPYPELAGL